MIYLIEGEEEYFIRQKIDSICKESNADIVKYDGNSKDFNIHDVFDSCYSNSLFAEKTVVLVKDPSFLIKKVDDSLLELIDSYVGNPEYETDLVLYTLENKFNNKLKVYKSISTNAQILNYNSYDYKNFPTYVRQQVNNEKLDIDNDAIRLLETIVRRSATLLDQNIIVLSNYPGHINADVVSKLCTASDELDSFEVINALTSKNVSLSISLIRKLLTNQDSILPVIALLSNQLRFLYEISFLNSIGKNTSQILDIVKCNEYRLKMAMNTLRNLNSKQIIYLLKKLSDLDIKTKNNFSIDEKQEFELFILELLKKDKHASN